MPTFPERTTPDRCQNGPDPSTLWPCPKHASAELRELLERWHSAQFITLSTPKAARLAELLERMSLRLEDAADMLRETEDHHRELACDVAMGSRDWRRRMADASRNAELSCRIEALLGIERPSGAPADGTEPNEIDETAPGDVPYSAVWKDGRGWVNMATDEPFFRAGDEITLKGYRDERVTPATSAAGVHDNPIIRIILADLAGGPSSVIGPALVEWMASGRWR